MTDFLHTEKVATFEELVLTKLKIRVMTGLSGAFVRDMKIGQMNSYADLIAEDLYTAAADLLVAAKETKHTGEAHHIPVTWWDHFKKQFFPKLGFKTEEIVEHTTIYRVCPHLNIPTCDKYAHFRWLKASDQEVVP